MSNNAGITAVGTAGPGTTGPAIRPSRNLVAALGAVGIGGILAIGVFLLFALLFLVVPTVGLIVGAFLDPQGQLTFGNIEELFVDPQILAAFSTSIKVSAITAIGGTVIGLALTLAIIRGKLPQTVRSTVMTFSGVASNFAGLPLAFAFIATLGRLGLVTLVMKELFGFDLTRNFNVLGFWGVCVTYLYFQIPLMVLIIAPAVDGLKKEWGEAAQTLGATNGQFWRYIGLPILWPNLLGSLSLLFANSFGAIATAYALAGTTFNIVPMLLYAQIQGDVLHNPGLGAALALGMIVITALANVIYLVVRTRAEKWLK
jgi:putative spermidine/putrescine transport system permease protein